MSSEEKEVKKSRFKDFWSKSSKKKKFFIIFIPVFLSLIGGGGFFYYKKNKNSLNKNDVKEEVSHQSDSGIVFLYQKVSYFLSSIHHKWSDLSVADVENSRLKLENANLRRWAESLRYGCQAIDAEHDSKLTGMKLTQETGAKVGRVLASIQYSPPPHLLPSQLYALAATYLKANEFEKAAVLMTFLTGLQDNDDFKTAKNYLVTGISWYQLDHFKLAETYFDNVLEFTETPHILPFIAQARLWKALVAEKLGDKRESQKWLREFLDHHPHSEESKWINGQRLAEQTSAQGERLPASEVESPKEAKKNESEDVKLKDKNKEEKESHEKEKNSSPHQSH